MTSQLVRNITKAYGNATESEVNEGLEWYSEANRIANKLSLDGLLDKRNGMPETAAGVLAAVSPQTQWEHNILIAAHLITGEPLTKGMFQTNVRLNQARRIINGERPSDVLKGRKVRAFYVCILEPYNHDTVVIDRHAMCAAEGRLMARQEQNKVGHSKALYQMYAEAYFAAADQLSLLPCELQAIVWVSWRNLHANKKRATNLGGPVVIMKPAVEVR